MFMHLPFSTGCCGAPDQEVRGCRSRWPAAQDPGMQCGGPSVCEGWLHRVFAAVTPVALSRRQPWCATSLFTRSMLTWHDMTWRSCSCSYSCSCSCPCPCPCLCPCLCLRLDTAIYPVQLSSSAVSRRRGGGYVVVWRRDPRGPFLHVVPFRDAISYLYMTWPRRYDGCLRSQSYRAVVPSAGLIPVYLFSPLLSRRASGRRPLCRRRPILPPRIRPRRTTLTTPTPSSRSVAIARVELWAHRVACCFFPKTSVGRDGMWWDAGAGGGRWRLRYGLWSSSDKSKSACCK